MVNILYLIGEVYSKIFVEAIVEWGCFTDFFLVDISGSYKHSSPSSTGFPEIFLMFDCGSLQLFPSVSG
ncbi:hypothetical protein H671_1g1598 [Cricetulus griseus]|nr:hypothetical protein H671_1g1598 [Cricetulus griseus]